MATNIQNPPLLMDEKLAKDFVGRRAWPKLKRYLTPRIFPDDPKTYFYSKTEIHNFIDNMPNQCETAAEDEFAALDYVYENKRH